MTRRLKGVTAVATDEAAPIIDANIHAWNRFAALVRNDREIPAGIRAAVAVLGTGTVPEEMPDLLAVGETAPVAPDQADSDLQSEASAGEATAEAANVPAEPSDDKPRPCAAGSERPRIDPLRLKRLRVQGLRGIRDLEVPFETGGLLILGDNGVGKSSLIDGLEWLLTERCSSLTGTSGISFDDHGVHLGVALHKQNSCWGRAPARMSSSQQVPDSRPRGQFPRQPVASSRPRDEVRAS